MGASAAQRGSQTKHLQGAPSDLSGASDSNLGDAPSVRTWRIVPGPGSGAVTACTGQRRMDLDKVDLAQLFNPVVTADAPHYRGVARQNNGDRAGVKLTWPRQERLNAPGVRMRAKAIRRKSSLARSPSASSRFYKFAGLLRKHVDGRIRICKVLRAESKTYTTTRSSAK